MLIRQTTAKMESSWLSPFATLSIASKGRLRSEQECAVRTLFQRDRDRIIHSKSFRRLKHKTQVFIIPEGDHYRTRLTHTLEVAQIARTIARALRLNEDLTEAIALGHDLGHTPFGHAGEEELATLSITGFKHNEHSLRLVDRLEGHKGLNLTWEVRDGILNHTGKTPPATLEGQAVRIADRIAYINHDIDDAIRGGILKPADLPTDCIAVLGSSHSGRINNMIIDVIRNSREKPSIKISKPVEQAMDNLRDFMFAQVYVGSDAKREETKAKQVIKRIYQHLMEYPQYLPSEYQQGQSKGTFERSVVDYIAGMTDRYAIRYFQKLFIPSPWVEK